MKSKWRMMEERTTFFRNLTFKRVMLYLFIAFLIFILMDALMNPQGTLESIREGYNQWEK